MPKPLRTGAASPLPVNHPARAPKPAPAAKPSPTPPVPKHPGGGAFTQRVAPVKQPKPINGADVARGTAKGATKMAASAAGDGQTAIMLLAASFVIITLAKVRGVGPAKDIKWQNALFGGFVLAFFLILIAKFSSRMANAFAGLVLVQVLLEFGPSVLPGLAGGGSPTTLGPVLGQTEANTPVVNSQRANTILYNQAGYFGPALPTSYK